MGAVAMKERSTGLVDRGYPVTEATLYIYCDACGSFNIKTYIPIAKLVIVAVILLLPLLIMQNIKEWLACLSGLLFFAFFVSFSWRDLMLRYKCRKCGNTRITDHNALHYQSYDLSVVDVPDYLTQKRYIDTDVLHFTQFT